MVVYTKSGVTVNCCGNLLIASGGNQLIMNYEQAQELFGIKFRRWLGIFNL